MKLSKDRVFYPEELLSVGWQHMHTSSPLPGPFCAQGILSSMEVVWKALLCQQRSIPDSLGQAVAGWSSLGQVGTGCGRLAQV